MAGIWERIIPTAEDRVPAHLLDAAFVFRGTNDFTFQQILNAINSQVATPLTQAETDDLGNISSTLNSQSNTTNKLVYLEKIKSALICAEMGVINEATFRSVLGIT